LVAGIELISRAIRIGGIFRLQVNSWILALGIWFILFRFTGGKKE